MTASTAPAHTTPALMITFESWSIISLILIGCKSLSQRRQSTGNYDGSASTALPPLDLLIETILILRTHHLRALLRSSEYRIQAGSALGPVD